MYNIFLWCYKAIIRVAALFRPKARNWVKGRRNIFARMEQAIPPARGHQQLVWMHCASLGEFEQGRPVLEALRSKYPGVKLLLTFFSPSGYEVQKNYAAADWVFYLPMDGPRNARRFLEIVNPSLVIFVKYEFWYYYLKKMSYRNIPLLLISGVFRRDMTFFKWYGAMMRKMLSRFDHLFVQNEESKVLLDESGFSDRTSLAGDTRFDRVAAIAAGFQPLQAIAAFTKGSRVIVAGSTWPEDEEVLKQGLDRSGHHWKLILAPHEISEKHLASIRRLFPEAVLYSRLEREAGLASARILVVDNYGLLSRLYQYATVAYVGGALTRNGVHNVLEAAVYGKVVLFGPEYHRYSEAIGLVRSGGGISFYDEKRDGVMLSQLLDVLAENEEELTTRSREAGEFVTTHRGATPHIMEYIQEKRLLTN